MDAGSIKRVKRARSTAQKVIHQVITYLQWFPKTFYLHGIHSPFVYAFVKECLRNKELTKNKNLLSQYRERLLAAERTITVTDFGAGSRVFKTNNRKIATIAKHVGATQKRMHFLQRFVAYYNPEQILEIGTSLGMATFAMAKGSKNTLITSLEGCPNTLAVAQETLAHFNITQVTLLEGRFRESIKTLAKHKLDMVYFDGNHSKEATLAYAQSLLPTAINGTVWIFDDIHWSREMTAAWEEIKALPEVSVSIDCYWLGIVFFRNEQEKEDFYVRLK